MSNRATLLAVAAVLIFGHGSHVGAADKSFDPGSSPHITLVLAPGLVNKYSIQRVTSPGSKADDGMSVSLWNVKSNSLVYTNLVVGAAAINLTPDSTYLLYVWGNKDPKAFAARFNLINTTQAKPVQGFFVGYDATIKVTADAKPVITLDSPKSEVVHFYTPYLDGPENTNGLFISMAVAKSK